MLLLLILLLLLKELQLQLLLRLQLYPTVFRFQFHHAVLREREVPFYHCKLLLTQMYH